MTSGARCVVLMAGVALACAASASAAPRVWTIAGGVPVEPSMRSLEQVVAFDGGPRGSFLMLGTTSQGRPLVYRLSATGQARRLAVVTGVEGCSDIAATPDGGATLTCSLPYGEALRSLVRIGADGARTDVTLRWSGVDALAPPALYRVDDAGPLGRVAVGHRRVFRIGADGVPVAVAGGGSGPVRDGASARDVDLGDVEDVVSRPDGVVIAKGGTGGARIVRVGRDGRFAVLAGGGRQRLRDGAPGRAVRLSRRLSSLAALPGGALAFVYAPESRAGMRLVRLGADGRLRVLGRPRGADLFNRGDGRAPGRADVFPGALGGGTDGSLAFGDAGRVRWIDGPQSRRLGVAFTSTRAAPPAVTVRASRRARLVVQVRRGGRQVARRSVTAATATVGLGALRRGTYVVRVRATDGRGHAASDQISLTIGINPTSGPDCTRVSALRVDCLRPGASLNDDEFGYAVVLRADGQLYSTPMDPSGKPGARIPRGAGWEWIDG